MYLFERTENKNNFNYTFSTIRNLKFYVRFSEYYDGGDGYGILYLIDIFCLTDLRVNLDSEIGKTISFIIKDAINSNERILVGYLCAIEDNRQKVRNRKFRSWFKKYNGGELSILNLAFPINEEDDPYLTGTIYNQNTYSHNQVLNRYKKVLIDLQK